MKRLFNKKTAYCALLGICLGVLIINIFVSAVDSMLMFILGVLTGVIIYEIDEESKINEPA